MSIAAATLRLASRIRAAHLRRVTERKLGALPFDIRKDIGWPQPVDHRQGATARGQAAQGC